MAMIAMAVYDTDENKRTEYTKRTLSSICSTVNQSKHRLIVVDNNSCKGSKEWIECYRRICPNFISTIILPENIGTARAINKAWDLRKPGEHCVKMDNDVVIHQEGWLDILEECIVRDPQIGIIGLKRKDLLEWPIPKESHWRSRFIALPHQPGQRWLSVEEAEHVMGTCQLYNSALLDKIGYLYQMGLKYSFDDSLSATRCRVAGFYSCFYNHIEIDHIDDGSNVDYTQAKRDIAGIHMERFKKVREEYKTGKRSIYHGPTDKFINEDGTEE